MQSSAFLLIVFSLCATKGQWIDPHSMDTEFKNKLPNGSQNPPKEIAGNCATISEKECDSDVHFRRTVRIILNNAYLDSDMGYREGYMNIRLSAREHQFLVDFSESSKSDEHVFKEISSIFEVALQKPSSEKYHDLILSWQERIHSLIFNPTFTALFFVFASALIAFYLTYKLLQAQFSWISLNYLMVLAYVVDFVITYQNIMREEEIENMVKIKKFGAVPPECDPEKMSWWTFLKTQFKSTFTENPCKEYYQATYQNFYFFITPSKVLTRQLRTLILEPFGDIGEAFGKFGHGLFTKLPWGLNIVIFPIMLIALLIIIFMVFFFIAKPHFKLSFFHWITIEIGQSVRTEAPPALTNETNRRQIGYTPNRPRHKRSGNTKREVGGTASHRALVEDVSNNESSRTHDGQKKVQGPKADSEKGSSQAETSTLLNVPKGESDISSASDPK